MTEPRFVTDAKGERVGVLLDMAAYERLVLERAQDAEVLTGLSDGELRALADSKLELANQERLHKLLAKRAETELEEAETSLLDELLEQVDGLNLLKARARYTLKTLDNPPEHDQPE